MARVTLQINGRAFELGCEDGGESHLRQLGADVDAKVRQVAPGAAGAGEARLILMAALLVADDLRNIRSDLAAAEARERRLEERLDIMTAKVVAALQDATVRLDAMAPD